MKSSRTRKLAANALAVTALTAPAILMAQQRSTDQTNSVLLVSVKQDALDEWTNLVKTEVLPALKKAGIPSVQTYQTVLGNGAEFSFVSPLDKMANLDLPPVFERALGKEAGAQLLSKLRKCTMFSRSYLATTVASLSNPAPKGKALPLRVYARYRVAPGKAGEYEAVIKNEILPAYKKAGVYFTYSRRGLGAPGAGEVLLITQAENFAALEGGPPARRILGEEGYAKMQARLAGLRTPVDTIVRRLRPDLSF